MGGKGSAPVSPNYSSLIESSTKAAELNRQTSVDQLNWAKQQYADQQPYTTRMMQNMADASDQNLAAGKLAQSRLENIYYPIENQFAAEASGYNSPERAAQRSAAAQADVSNTFQGQRDAALHSLESYGIDPSQTRYGALDLGARITQAAAQASAATTSRNQSEATGLALQGQAINIGRGYPGQVAQNYNTAAGTGSSGVNAGLQTASTYGNLMGTATNWAGLGNQTTNTAVGAMNTGYQNQMAAFNANTAIAQNQASGIGALIGAGIGLGAAALGGKG